jgi:hypothetical protein
MCNTTTSSYRWEHSYSLLRGEPTYPSWLLVKLHCIMDTTHLLLDIKSRSILRLSSISSILSLNNTGLSCIVNSSIAKMVRV